MTEEQILDDIIAVMIGGGETVSHSLVSALYYITKCPEIQEKVMEEIKAHKISTDEEFKKNFTYETLNNLDYLTCCIKEAFRIDTSVPESLDYIAKENVNICGIDFKKGANFKIDITTPHYEDSWWLDPSSFIPDRHDPESEFYKKSKKQGKIPHTYSRRTFGVGPRICPGQVFAMFEIKVILIYILTHYEVKFDEKDLKNEGIGFALGCHFVPKVKMYKK